MKKLFSDLILPAVIVTMLIMLLSASFAADDIITNHREQFIAVMNQDHTQNNKLLIIDPGHGGADGGAVSVTGGKESEINLSIALKTELLSAFFGTETVLTRSEEDIDYPSNCDTIRKKKVFDTKQRVELIRSYSDAILISIHQNNFSDSSVHGAQVFFRTPEDSYQLSENITDNLTQFSDLVRAPVQISDSIYIFSNIKCPAVMIECGFLSNHRENALLKTDTYQTKLAISILSGYLKSYGGTNEIQNSLLLY